MTTSRFKSFALVMLCTTLSGVIQFIRSIILNAITIGVIDNLVETIGCVGRDAVKAHQRGGISIKWLNLQLMEVITEIINL